MQSIRRLYVAKKGVFADEAKRMLADLQENLLIKGLTDINIFHRYDVAGLDDAAFEAAKTMIFSEPPVDAVYDELPVKEGDTVLAIEYLPGQYDQRADSAMQCLQMLTMQNDSLVRTARVVVLSGDLSDEDVAAIKHYCINPVEAREASLDPVDTLEMAWEQPADVAVIEGFTTMDDAALKELSAHMGLAMSFDDLKFCQTYFGEEEKRNPTVTEIRVIDTYWSDHCRHTTFMTELTDVAFEDGKFTAPIQRAYEAYKTTRENLNRKKPQTLMDMATIAVKELKAAGKLQNLDESDEINACTIIIPVDVDGVEEEWLLLFKNETHNHPTEIEPFGGAATCLGGCIRDPLSGRSYVYQAMRVTGAGDPRQAVKDTLKGKLPQRTLTTGAAKGYSSYGNQIGLATGEVKEYYNQGFVAKRMEIGAVLGAAPRCNVVREAPVPGDIIILLGGKTGRDGCGGATGSSKKHTVESLETCGAEVQKGNALTERKIQRLFRRHEVTVLIKRCNDFGAGGVSVAIGELTDGLDIKLDKVPKKYEGLDGTELAISESQERMAVVVAPEHVDEFMKYAAEENLEATIVAVATDTKRLVMHWRGQNIVNITRAFLDTNGVTQRRKAFVTAPEDKDFFTAPEVTDVAKTWLDTMGTLNIASEQGLAERFDSTIGARTVLMPFGGKYQKTPVEGMVAKIPVMNGKTTTASIFTHGYDPDLAIWSPFHGALYAVVQSIAKLVALGGDRKKVYLTMQEFFQSLGTNEKAWGQPVSALLGAYIAQKEMGVAAIGGKDSMSGTFENLTVPPTLVSFAIVPEHTKNIVSPEFKQPGNAVLLFDLPRDGEGVPDFDAFKANCDFLHEAVVAGKVKAMHAVGQGGVAAAIAQMAFGNGLGVEIDSSFSAQELFNLRYGAIVVEANTDDAVEWVRRDNVCRVGLTRGNGLMEIGDVKIALADLQKAWEEPLNGVFPIKSESGEGDAELPLFTTYGPRRSESFGKPRVFIPVCPGTNCEYDSAEAFERAGAVADVMVLRNNTAQDLAESIDEMAKRIAQAQIIMFPGGFSAGDEPEGSGKFIATLFRNPALTEALESLLYQRDGLALGICNGFQALIKLGLLPYGHVQPLKADSPTLTYNTIGRHLSRMVDTKVVSVMSPWFSNVKAGDVHTVAISHGEGRFVASPEQIRELAAKGQIATQYVDLSGKATYDSEYNPNQSVLAVEGITSPDGRVLGKMAHTERFSADDIFENISGNKLQPIFAAGVAYFK
ncbi:phosphoribosylformylglycinamidine synthase [Megasphaera butyrica]|uniref:phosphoribosylformylglycinamidine synthase n=1 Tax=Megasphaera butyrica TaxID=2981791 RepID=UPI000822EF7C|nr:phosphoribosylformylglycinamidine synthase [Megasphaera butyrica]MCU6713747.1 phosphoribosylformylglycinamidine synthase [Megasphaera butyrica]SCH16744.1 Phosphoribosylformylglycinamidine synthase [uncultured Megasphaera sp.]SCI87562.1 Phosphoribosylformylglycinamidine synthase [uncultured Ruminococcus sp.]